MLCAGRIVEDYGASDGSDELAARRCQVQEERGFCGCRGDCQSKYECQRCVKVFGLQVSAADTGIFLDIFSNNSQPLLGGSA